MNKGMFLNLTDVREINENSALFSVLNERTKQQKQWGIQTHSITEWLTILGEEYGEACKAGLETYYKDANIANLRKELVQTTAVGLAIIEAIDNYTSHSEEGVNKNE